MTSATLSFTLANLSSTPANPITYTGHTIIDTGNPIIYGKDPFRDSPYPLVYSVRGLQIFRNGHPSFLMRKLV
jgi:hypothetical protein